MEGDAVNQLISQYSAILNRLKVDLRNLQRDIDKRTAAGQEVSPAWLFQQNRYKDLILQVNQGMSRVTRATSPILTDTNARAVEAAADYARKASHAQLERTQPVPGAAASVMAGWNGLNKGAIKSIIGNTQPGSPLWTLISRNGEQVGKDVQSALIRAVATGKPGRDIAKDVQRAMGGGLSRSMTIVRTEMHRAQREATRRTYEDNGGIVAEWIWRTNKTTRACAACWALDGQRFGVEERQEAHVNCRCTMVPKTASWQSLGFPGIPDIAQPTRGRDRFEGLPEADKIKILGKGGYRLYKDHHIPLGAFVDHVRSTEWGGSFQVKSLRDIRAYHNIPPPGKKPPKGTPPPVLPPPPPPPPPKRTPAELMREEAAAARNNILTQSQADQAEIDRIEREIDALSKDFHDGLYGYEQCLHEAHTDAQSQHCENVYLPDIAKAEAAMLKKRQEQDALRRTVIERQREHLKVKDPLPIHPNYITNTTKAVKASIQRGFDVLSSFVSASGRPNLLNAVNARTGAPSASGTLEVDVNFLAKNGRAFHRGGGIHVTRDETPGVVAHELGHMMEYVDRDLHVAVQRYLVQRTTDPVTGVRAAPEQLSKIFKGYGYSAWETAWRDKFINAYTGKDYGGRASELTSMTIQGFYEDPYKQASEDPDMFDFIYGMMRGVDVTK